METTEVRKRIYELIEMYAPECSEPKKLCSSFEDIVDELAESKVLKLHKPCVTNPVKNGESASAIRHDHVQRLEVAATFNTERSAPHIYQLIGYRQKIAQELLRSGTEDYRKSLDQNYEYVQEQLKLVLGI